MLRISLRDRSELRMGDVFVVGRMMGGMMGGDRF
jgi:hypothetical protein